MTRFRSLLLLILLVVLFFTFFTPYPLINSDSVSGFNALKGQQWTGRFNSYFVYDPTAHRFNIHFLTWWSPGQYVMPGILMRFFGLSLGHAVTLLNCLCLLLGTAGFALVYKRYRFPPMVIFLSILMILFSGTVLYRYYSYQGGESLNFLLFPWIIVAQDILFRRYLNFILPGLVVLLAFFFKLQLLIIVPPLLLLLYLARGNVWSDLPFLGRTGKIPPAALGRLALGCLPVVTSIALAFGLIYRGFMALGSTPASASVHGSFHMLNVLVPFASPMTSFYAGEAGFNMLHSLTRQSLYLFMCSLILLFLFFFILRDFRKADVLRKKYVFIAFCLFAFSVLVFSFLYSEGNIDYNTRHFKLTSFLFYPLFFDALLRRVSAKIVGAVAAVLVVIAIGNHLRLSRTWLRDTPVTASGFRLLKSDMPLPHKARLDSLIRQRTIVVSPYDDRYSIDNDLILPVMLPLTGKTYAPLAGQGLGYPVIYIDSSFSMH